MKKITDLQAIVLDYGGTLDTNGHHWAAILWEAYQSVGFPITESQFREAYVFAERALAKAPIIKADDDFFHLLLKKVENEIAWLEFRKQVRISGLQQQNYIYQIANYCNDYVLRNLERTRPVLSTLQERFSLHLVSNFYGNISTVLRTYNLSNHFASVTESASVGVRKPDPAIFQLALGKIPAENPSEVLVVGDSFKKDILPARSIGCKTVWLKGHGWTSDEECDSTIPDAIITDFQELLALI